MIRVVDRSDDFLHDLFASVDAGVAKAALMGSEIAAKSMPGAGAGVSGTRRGRNQYRPSDPGSPPGVRSSRLKGSLSSARLGPMVHGFGTNVRYARALELGATTPGGQPFWKDRAGNLHFAKKTSPHAWRMAKTKPGRIAARPFLRPVVVNHKTELERAFTRTASREMARRAVRGVA